MALTKVINDLADLNQSGSTNALKGCAGTTAEQPASSSSIEYLIVGGGGAGGRGSGGGGGGAGGYVIGTGVNATTVYHGTPTVITVGEGGEGSSSTSNQYTNGDDSGFNGIRAIGGGVGGFESANIIGGILGGSGGGGCYYNGGGAGSGTTLQGNAGGIGGSGNPDYTGGGGGGSGNPAQDTNGIGQAGGSSAGGPGTGTGGAGGSGTDITSFISVANANLAQIGDTSNTTQVFIAGGGGGGSQNGATSGIAGTGGAGGGGNGMTYNNIPGEPPAEVNLGGTNTGGGGGGGNNYSTPSPAGGSGVAILKYDNTIVTGYSLNSEDTYTVNWPADKYGAAYWPLNLNAKDVGGHYDGAATDVTYVTGKFNQAASFNGSSSIIQGTQPAQSESFTISAWVKTTASGAWNIAVAMGGTATHVYGLSMWISGTSNSLYGQWGNGSSEDYWSTLPTTVINTGEWFHIAVTVNNIASPTVKGYINGVLEGSGYSAGSPVAITFDPSLFTIGGRENTSGTLGYYWNGEIEQVRFYGSELSLTDIQDIYNNSKPGSLPPLKTSSDLTTTLCNFPTGVTGECLYQLEANGTDTCTNYDLTTPNNSPTYGTGKFGNCAVFNGSNQSFDQVSNWGDPTVFSLSFWINFDVVNVNQEIVGCYNWNGATSSGWKIRLLGASSKIEWQTYLSNTQGTATSNQTISASTWTHVAFTADQSTVNLYINGILDHTTSISGFNYHGGVAAEIGEADGYDYLDGKLDQFRFFTSVLTAQQVYDLWQKENSIQTYFSMGPSDTPANTDILVFKEGSGEITFKNDSPPGAEIGMLRYNSTLNKMEHFNSGGWKDFSYCTTDLCDYPTQADSVLLYRFNDDVTDTCGTYNGTAGGSLSYTAGKFGKAINTTSGYVDTGYIFPTDSTMSVSFWMNLTTAPGATDVYMLSDMDSGAANLRLALRIAGAYSNKLYIDISDGSSSDAKDTGWIPAYNTWYHIAITFNGTAVVLYVDGVSTLSYTSTVAFGTAGAQQQVIGRPGAHTSCCYFPGLIDQFRLFTSTLTANEVLDLYNEVQC